MVVGIMDLGLLCEKTYSEMFFFNHSFIFVQNMVHDIKIKEGFYRKSQVREWKNNLFIALFSFQKN